MVTRTIQTNKYDVDLEKLLSRRLSQCDCAYATEQGAEGVAVSVRGAEALPCLAGAVTMLLCRDLQYFELAHMADELPLTLQQKQEVLTEALQAARASERLEPVRCAVLQYLSGQNLLNVEGYLCFRMREATEQWRLCVERAAADQLLDREYSELMALLRSFAALEPRGLGEVSVCLHPDGSCTLTDDSDARIEYVDGSEDGILSLLIGMSPQRLTVYDLSGGGNRIADTLARVFAGRIRIYR